MPEPEPKDEPSDERSEILKRQEAEMRKIFGLPPEWGIADLKPKDPKRIGE